MDTEVPNTTSIAAPGAVGEGVFIGDGGTATLDVTGTGTLDADAVVVNNRTTGFGTLNVTGPDARITATTLVNVGQDGDGIANISGGGQVLGDQIGDGDTQGATGTINVDGAGSLIRSTGAGRVFSVGFLGDGNLNVTNGAHAESAFNLVLGVLATGVGTAIVDGNGSLIFTNAGITVGNVGVGTLTLRNGGDAASTAAVVGGFSGAFSGLPARRSDGLLTVTGSGSQLLISTPSSSGILAIGQQGDGDMQVLAGGTAVVFGEMQIGNEPGGIGNLTIDGANSRVGVSGRSYIGQFGTAQIDVTNGGLLLTGSNAAFIRVRLGSEATGQGTVNVTGPGSRWTSPVEIRVGDVGTGEITVSNGGVLEFASSLDLAVEIGSVGTVTVTGAGSTITETGGTLLSRLGNAGTARFNVENGGTATFINSVFLGDDPTSDSLLRVDGAGSKATFGDSLVFDGPGTTRVEVTNGGLIDSAGSIGLGLDDGGNHSLLVTGPGSRVQAADLIVVGRNDNGVARFEVLDGASFETSSFIFFGDSPGNVTTVIIDGSTTRLDTGGSMRIGDDGNATMSVTGGATVNTNRTIIASDAASVSTLTLDGAGTTYTDSGGSVEIGYSGTAVFNVSNGAAFTHTGGGGTTIAVEAGSRGTVNIGGAGTPADPGAFTTSQIMFGPGTGIFNFNHTASAHEFASPFAGSGQINALAGTTRLTGDSSGFSGTTSVNGGNLAVMGILGGRVEVINGTLSGTGTVGETVVSGTVAPGASIGTLTVSGNYTQNASGLLEIEIAGNGTSDLLNVTGTASLAGGVSVLGIGYPTGYPAAQTYTILTAAGGVTGTFDTVTDNLPDVDVTASYTASTVMIGYTGLTDPGPGPDPDPDPDPGPDPDPDPGPDPTPPVTTFSDKSILPNSLQGALYSGRMFSDMLLRHGVGVPQSAPTQSGLPGVASAYAKATSKTEEMFFGYGYGDGSAAGGTFYSAWAGGFGVNTDIDPTGTASGLDLDAAGFAGGVDMLSLNGDWQLLAGLAAGYSSSNISSTPSSADVDTVHVGGYASLNKGPLLLSSAIAYGFQTHHTRRVIPLAGMAPAIALGKADGGTFNLAVEASYDIAPGLGLGVEQGLRIAPMARLNYARSTREAFVETGANILNLAVQSSDYQQTWLATGIEFAATFRPSGAMRVTPRLSLMYEHGFGSRSAVVNSALANVANTPFTTSGAAAGRDAFVLGGGVSIDFSESFSVNAGYEGRFSNTSTSQGGSLVAKWRF